MAVLAQGQADAEAQAAGRATAQVEAHTRAWARVADSDGGRTHGQVLASRIQEIRDRAQAKAGAVAQVQGGLTHGMPVARAQAQSLDASALITQMVEAQRVGNECWRDMITECDRQLSAVEQAMAHRVQTESLNASFMALVGDAGNRRWLDMSEAELTERKHAEMRRLLAEDTTVLSVVGQAEAYIEQTKEAERRSRLTRSTRMDLDRDFTETKTETNKTKTDWNFTKTKMKTNGKKTVKKKKEWRDPQSGVTRDPGKSE